MVHFSYKSILCYLGWPVCKRNFVSFSHKILRSVGKSNKPERRQEGEETKIFSHSCIKTPEAATQDGKNYIPKYSSGNLTQLRHNYKSVSIGLMLMRPSAEGAKEYINYLERRIKRNGYSGNSISAKSSGL